MLETKAVKITEKIHPIAVACLAAGFGTIPIEKTLGHYLVINELDSVYFKREGNRPWLVVGNSWMTVETFNERYFFINGEEEDEFQNVARH